MLVFVSELSRHRTCPAILHTVTRHGMEFSPVCSPTRPGGRGFESFGKFQIAAIEAALFCRRNDKHFAGRGQPHAKDLAFRVGEGLARIGCTFRKLRFRFGFCRCGRVVAVCVLDDGRLCGSQGRRENCGECQGEKKENGTHDVGVLMV